MNSFRAIIALCLVILWTTDSLAFAASSAFPQTPSPYQNQLLQWSGTSFADFLPSSADDLLSESGPLVHSDSRIFAPVAGLPLVSNYAPPSVESKLHFFAALFIRAP